MKIQKFNLIKGFLKRNFDYYEFKKFIGKGGYSRVYSAFNVLTNEDVTVKMLNHNRMDKIKREIMIL